MWITAVGFEGMYEVSEQGEVRSLDREDSSGRRIKGVYLKNHVNWAGYHSVRLSKNSLKKFWLVHRLVLTSFKGPAPKDSPYCLHGNGDKSDNTLGTLRWGSAVENAQDNIIHGTNYEAQKTRCDSGHDFNEENTYVRPDGGRNCRTCGKINARRYRGVEKERKTND